MEEDIRVLQIGLGNFGKQHLNIWKELGIIDSGNLLVSDVDVAAFQTIKDQYGLSQDQFYADQSLVRDKIDAVDIVTPADAHYNQCIHFLEAGKDVLVEKPMTMSVLEAQKLADKVEETKIILQVGYRFAYSDLTTKLSDYLAQETLGDIRYIKADFKGFKRPRTDVGVTHSDAIHFIDVLCLLMGSEPRVTHSTMKGFFERENGKYGDPFLFDDLSVIGLDFNGIPALVEAGYIQPGKHKDPDVPGAMTTKTITVMGEKGTAVLDYEAGTFVVHDAIHTQDSPGIWSMENKGESLIDIDIRNPMKLEFEAFLSSLKSREEPLANARRSVITQRVVEEAYRLARSGS